MKSVIAFVALLATVSALPQDSAAAAPITPPKCVEGCLADLAKAGGACEKAATDAEKAKCYCGPEAVTYLTTCAPNACKDDPAALGSLVKAGEACAALLKGDATATGTGTATATATEAAATGATTTAADAGATPVAGAPAGGNETTTEGGSATEGGETEMPTEGGETETPTEETNSTVTESASGTAAVSATGAATAAGSRIAVAGSSLVLAIAAAVLAL
jgi:hypothetical protein